MEFLVHIEVRWPPEGDEALRQELIQREAGRAAELAEQGRILRLWRVPGRWANVGVWAGRDATEVHDAIASLPFFPWLEVRVEALAQHPSDPSAWEG